MKTIQEYLKNTNRKELIGSYLYKYPIRYELYPDKKVSEIKEAFEKKFNNLLDKLISLTPKENSDYIIFGHRIIHENFFDDVDFFVVRKQDVLNMDKLDRIESYGIEFDPFEEIIAINVAENNVTQKHIIECLVHIIREATFFGWEQEYVESTIESIKESEKDIEEGNYKSWDEIKEEFEKEFGFNFDDESPDEKELHNKIEAEYAKYYEHSRRKELKQICEALKNKTNKS